MRVLVTGGLGLVGRQLVPMLVERGHEVVVLELGHPANRRQARSLPREVRWIWGDLRQLGIVREAVRGCAAIVHLAAVIPPASETDPELARAVNVEGTRNLVAAAEEAGIEGPLLLASSVSVHGCRDPHGRPVRVDDPLVPVDTYNQTKIAAEAIVRESSLRWAILRIGAVLPFGPAPIDPIMFRIGLEERVEVVHPKDVARAFANALTTPEAWGRPWLIGGGPACRMRYGEFFREMLGVVGLRLRPELFADGPFYTDWMDTAESQAILRYQVHDFTSYLREYRRALGWRRPLARLLHPVVQRWFERRAVRAAA